MSRLQQLQKLLEMDEQDADVLYMIAQEHAHAGRHMDAVGWYDRCVSADPGYAYAHFHKARSLESAGRVAEAKAALTEGAAAARKAGDGKALGEIEQYLSQL